MVVSSHCCCVFLFVNTCLVGEKNVSVIFGCGMMKLLCSFWNVSPFGYGMFCQNLWFESEEEKFWIFQAHNKSS